MLMVPQIVEKAVERTRQEPHLYRSNNLPALSLDDQLWHQAISTNHYLYNTKRECLNGFAENQLYDLLMMGTKDFGEMDRPWDSSTRSIRYSAAVTGYLWDALRDEKIGVRVPSHRLGLCLIIG